MEHPNRRQIVKGGAAAALGALLPRTGSAQPQTVLNDASRLNPTPVVRHWVAEENDEGVFVARLRTELRDAALARRPVAIGGARHSMGAQSLSRNGTAMTFNSNIVEPDRTARTYRVHSGTSWKQVIAALDRIGFSSAVMQSNNDFSTGGTLSVNALASKAPCRTVTYGLGPGVTWSAADIQSGEEATRFSLIREGSHVATVTLPLAGQHNVANTLGVLAAVEAVGVDVRRAAGFLPGFAGIARRMQVRGSVDGVMVIDDFAHHPTKVRETLRAVQERYPRSYLVAVFEPRTATSRRKVFQDAYSASFASADEVVLVPPFDAEKIPEADRFDSAALVATLQQNGQTAVLHGNADAVVADFSGRLRNGTVVVIMSNGAFDNIHEKLLSALRARQGVKR